MLSKRDSLSLSATKGKNPPSSLVGDDTGEKIGVLLLWKSYMGWPYPSGLGVTEDALPWVKSGSGGAFFCKYLLGACLFGSLWILKLESSRFN